MFNDNQLVMYWMHKNTTVLKDCGYKVLGDFLLIFIIVVGFLKCLRATLEQD